MIVIVVFTMRKACLGSIFALVASTPPNFIHPLKHSTLRTPGLIAESMAMDQILSSAATTLHVSKFHCPPPLATA
jgi:hypothetical protein